MDALQIPVAPDAHMSAIAYRGHGALTIVFLHDQGLDLDSLRPLAAAVGVPEAHKIVVDLPGHGLSPDPPPRFDLAGEFSSWLAQQEWSPLIVVGAGRAAALTLRIAGLEGVLGVALLAPRLDPGEAEPQAVQVPTLAVLPAKSSEVVDDWHRLRRHIRSRWLSVSVTAEYDDIVHSGGPFRRQLATHLRGFVRELYGLHRQRAARDALSRR